jgi:hypothetical protein
MSLAAEAFLGRPDTHHTGTWVAAENRLTLNTAIRLHQHGARKSGGIEPDTGATVNYRLSMPEEQEAHARLATG